MTLPLFQFLEAVQNDKREEISSYFADMDQITANQCLEELSGVYRFKTFWEPGAFVGWRVMLGQDLADVMYGTRDVRGLGQLLRRYGIDLIDIRASQHNVATLKAYFGLAKTVSQVSFATWKHFLIAGMKGETELARRVCAYLIAREGQGRIADAALEHKPRRPIDLLREVVDDHEERIATTENEVKEVKGHLTVIQGGLSAVNTTAVNAQHTALQTQREMIRYKQRQLKNAQTYLKDEITAVMRGKIFEFAAYKCLRCGCVMTLQDGLPNSCEIDEVLPRAKGGNRTWDNIQALCRTCNGERGKAAQRGVNVEWSWDFRDRFPPFIAACKREQRLYELSLKQQVDDLPLFSV